jgi:hypothetical protein
MIQLVHVPRLGLQIFLVPKHLSESPTVPLTFVHQPLSTQRVLFQLGPGLSYFPVGSYLPRFDGKVAPLLRLARFFELADLDQQVISVLLIRQDVRLQLLILFPQLA